jgi:branched-chain amino acid transport system ATP-binding protein
MFKVGDLSVSIGAVAIIRSVSLELAAGEMCGLIGRNGAGKTTLMRALMGALPASGTAELDGIDLLFLPPHRRLAHGIGYMPEDRRLVPEFTSEENIRLPSWAARFSDVDERLDWVFAVMLEVARLRRRRALELSGGQQKMVALARALMAGRRMLLLDEPFEGLAPAIAQRLGEVLGNLKAQTISMLISESNGIHVADLLARVYRIERGTVTRT